jgi:hypothetical protein
MTTVTADRLKIGLAGDRCRQGERTGRIVYRMLGT